MHSTVAQLATLCFLCSVALGFNPLDFTNTVLMTNDPRQSGRYVVHLGYRWATQELSIHYTAPTAGINGQRNNFAYAKRLRFKQKQTGECETLDLTDPMPHLHIDHTWTQGAWEHFSTIIWGTQVNYHCHKFTRHATGRQTVAIWRDGHFKPCKAVFADGTTMHFHPHAGQWSHTNYAGLQHIQNAFNIPPNCACVKPVDFVFVLDRSGSMGHNLKGDLKKHT